MLEQQKQEKTYRIKVTTPVGTWVSLPAPHEQVEEFVSTYQSPDINCVWITTASGRVFIRHELVKQSILEVLEESEAVQENPEADSEGWIENTGEQPFVTDLVDIRLENGNIYEGQFVYAWYWGYDKDLSIVKHWRLSK